MIANGLIRLVIASLGLAVLSFAPAHAQFESAAGKVEITPTKTVFMAGYGSNRKSVGAHDPLWARCIVLKNGVQTVVLVSCDVLGISSFHGAKIRALITKVPKECVLIGATHTHSGPDTYGQWGPNMMTSGVDKEWMASLYQKVAKLVDDTVTKTKPSSLQFGNIFGIEKASKNIRVKQMLDTELAAMRIMGQDGKTIATLINYACHPEVLNNKQLTSDFPNWLRMRVEERLGGVAVYMNGAQGGMVTTDVQNESSYPKGEAWPEAERIGNLLGDKAVECLIHGQVVLNPAITFQHRVFQVPLQNNGFKMLIKAGVIQGVALKDDVIETEVNRFTIGKAEFITLPGEVLPTIGMYLKRKMTGTWKFQLGLTCDALGYILTPEDYGQELYKYETSVSIGESMGRIMEENLLSLIAAGAQKPARNIVK